MQIFPSTQSRQEKVLKTYSRLRIAIRGAVQGVGFRPFIYRLATDLGLKGWVNNSSQGVFIEVEGSQSELETFLLRIEREKPPRSFIQSLEFSFLDPKGYRNFEIKESEPSGKKEALILPDIATCRDCLEEIFDPQNRRFRYPFTNCTNCGPRFSIIEDLPYDRSNTTMKKFNMCGKCLSEYNDPLNRRFHAQPNACPNCGPHLELWNRKGKILASHDEALMQAVEMIRQGRIVAVKGLGGFHLIVDAGQDETVLRLRNLKSREEKPFALMYPSMNVIEADCEVSELEKRLLVSPESPIVLLKCRGSSCPSRISPHVAPANPNLGIMLPYTPLHRLLMREVGLAVVATSGNFSDEPICTDENEALQRLSEIADLFLIHNRPIARPVDDSIARVILGRELILRRSRGYAPLPIHLHKTIPSALAVGAHLKNTVALSTANKIFISQHIGDLETAQAFEAFQKVIADFQDLYGVLPGKVGCDLHPDYLSSKFAKKYGPPVVCVQHHYAHVLSCMAENELDDPVLGVAWDGTGYGLDGTIWGGEFLRILDDSFRRIAYLRTFPLPGGETAIKEPRRTALGLLYELLGEQIFDADEIFPMKSFSQNEKKILKKMLKNKINTPITSSAGRLFDGVASICGLRQVTKFEGQAAMELEFTIDETQTNEAYPFRIPELGSLDSKSEMFERQQPYILDWGPMIQEILDDVRRRVPVSRISLRFHNALVQMIVEIAKKIGENRVVLSGGCFQNRYLTEQSVKRLKREGFSPYWHQRVPPNDGGIALGQVMAILREHQKEAVKCV
jgi:hydrogenase maturation protein HypF